jgi:hypothetical protein
MKIIKFYLFLLVVSLLAHAATADEWFCSTQSSARDGNEIKACGVSVKTDEAKARDAAFDNSNIEARKICQGSNDCRHHKVTIIPQRTECKKVIGEHSDGRRELAYKCTRLVSYLIGDE